MLYKMNENCIIKYFFNHRDSHFLSFFISKDYVYGDKEVQCNLLYPFSLKWIYSEIAYKLI